MKITIIGAGNMGGAIARGLAKNEVFKENEITVTARSQRTLDELKKDFPGFYATNDNTEAVKDADVIVLAVKPWMLESVVVQIRRFLDFTKQRIISVVAGVTFDELQRLLTTDESCNPVLFRVIPNTAVAIGESMTIISERNATEEQLVHVRTSFEKLGKVVVVDEALIGAATALCSCGTAYAFKYIKASMDAAVEMGFYPAEACRMISQTVLGAAKLLLENGTLPEEEIYKVTTPGGITIKGLNAMEAEGFNHAVIQGVKASVRP
ncbi:MAG: pyrroline-5-carboxylate reductase [Bacteroidales bacterium]